MRVSRYHFPGRGIPPTGKHISSGRLMRSCSCSGERLQGPADKYVLTDRKGLFLIISWEQGHRHGMFTWGTDPGLLIMGWGGGGESVCGGGEL